MKTENPHKRIILSLIKDDIVNANLLNGLHELGINAGDHYSLHISESVLSLMGFEEGPQTDPVFDLYFELIGEITPCNPQALVETLDVKAQEIYSKVLSLKSK